MKQALTFTPPILSSTESKLNVEAFDASVEAFENHEYLKSFYALLDYINGDFRTKYGNVQGNEFHIPHGSIIVNIKLDEEKLSITAPFVALPEKGRIPLLRQVAGLNFNAMDLATIYLRDNAIAIVGASAAHGFRLMPVTPVCIMVPQSEPVPRGSNPRNAAVAPR